MCVFSFLLLLKLLPQFGSLLHPLHLSLGHLLFPSICFRRFLITIFFFHVESEDTCSCLEVPLCLLFWSVNVMVMILLIMVTGLSSSLSLLSVLTLHGHNLSVSGGANVHCHINL